jgi:hypothetical protein
MDYLCWNIGYYKQDINKYNHLKILYLDSVDIDNESVTNHEIGLTAKDTKKENEEKILGLLKKDLESIYISSSIQDGVFKDKKDNNLFQLTEKAMDKCEKENCFGFVSFAKPGRLVYYNRTGNEFEVDRYNTNSGLKRVVYKKNCGNEEQKKDR